MRLTLCYLSYLLCGRGLPCTELPASRSTDTPTNIYCYCLVATTRRLEPAASVAGHGGRPEGGEPCERVWKKEREEKWRICVPVGMGSCWLSAG
jgi:hypothetical protein